MRLAFMYRTQTSNDSNTFRYFVIIAKYSDWSPTHVNWMGDSDFKDFNPMNDSGTLVPSLDIQDSKHEFNTPEEAIKFMAEHYSAELRVQSIRDWCRADYNGETPITPFPGPEGGFTKEEMVVIAAINSDPKTVVHPKFGAPRVINLRGIDLNLNAPMNEED